MLSIWNTVLHVTFPPQFEKKYYFTCGMILFYVNFAPIYRGCTNTGSHLLIYGNSMRLVKINVFAQNTHK